MRERKVKLFKIFENIPIYIMWILLFRLPNFSERERERERRKERGERRHVEVSYIQISRRSQFFNEYFLFSNLNSSKRERDRERDREREREREGGR